MSIAKAGLLGCLCALSGAGVGAERLLTPAEASNWKLSPDAAETRRVLEQLDQASEQIELRRFGSSATGRDLLVVIAGENNADREVILVQAGIHAGEIEGKDAGLLLLAEIAADSDLARRWLSRFTLVFVPMFNVDGHERRSAFNRINQNGPQEMGWRGTAQRANLNRDYLKADTPEMRALLGLINEWNPDLVIDTHTTNGADYQYDLTWYLEEWGNQHPAIRAWQKASLIDRVFPRLEAEGHLLAPYLEMVDGTDPSKGFVNFGSGPRFSTGYAAVRNRPGLLVETHMLKSYQVRVDATRDLLAAIFDDIASHPGALRAAVRKADAETVARAGLRESRYPISLATTGQAEEFVFKGYAYTVVDSDISGGRWIRYDPGQKKSMTVPFQRELRVQQNVNVPAGFVIPAAWSRVIERLQVHGVRLERVAADAELQVGVSLLSDPQFAKRSFEGRVMIEKFRHEHRVERATVRAGDWLVPLDQALAGVALHVLEPDGPDSALRLGDFNLIFEQREYADARVAEQLARDLLQRDPALRQRFQTRLDADAAFAADPYARLNWFVQQSDWRERDLGRYPVLRVNIAGVRVLRAAMAGSVKPAS